MNNNRLQKQERLSGRKRIETLFSGGCSGFVYPFRYVFTVSPAGGADMPPDGGSYPGQQGGVSVLISVPKKNHKRAVKRNKVRRRTREAFRLAKGELYGSATANSKQLDVALIYVSKEIEEFKTIENAVGKILAELTGSI